MFHIGLSLLNCLAAMLLVIGHRNNSSSMMAAGETVGVMSMVLSALKLIVDLLQLLRWFYTRYMVLRRKRAERALLMNTNADNSDDRIRVGSNADDGALVDEENDVGRDFEQLALRFEAACQRVVAVVPHCLLPGVVQVAGSGTQYDESDEERAADTLAAKTTEMTSSCGANDDDEEAVASAALIQPMGSQPTTSTLMVPLVSQEATRSNFSAPQRAEASFPHTPMQVFVVPAPRLHPVAPATVGKTNRVPILHNEPEKCWCETPPDVDAVP